MAGSTVSKSIFFSSSSDPTHSFTYASLMFESAAVRKSPVQTTFSFGR